MAAILFLQHWAWRLCGDCEAVYLSGAGGQSGNGIWMYWWHGTAAYHTLTETGGRLNKKDGLTRYGNSHVKDKTS